MTRSVVVIVGLILGLSSVAFAQKARLVGRWQNENDPRLVMDLRADGTAGTTLGEATWAVKGSVLEIGGVPMSYVFKGKTLFISLGATKDIPHKRLGPPKKAPKAAAPPAEGKSSSGGGNLHQLLTASAWCSFTYNKTSGTSSSSRVVFLANGTLRRGSNTETSNSGRNGTVAGQHQGGSSNKWRVAGGRLYVDGADMNARVKNNSAGNPIITAGGKEYMRCK